MTLPHPMGLTVRAPAKLNLGLEVIGRRPDGYHDLATIFQAITLYDDLTLSPAPDLRLDADDRTLIGPDNLALLALSALRQRASLADGAALRLVKRIPVAAGLGGASSDAAAALLAARRLWQAPLNDDDLLRLAADLGSDVSFFLWGGTALASGRGERLAPLPPPLGVRFVVVSPTVVLPRKTASLYAALAPADFSDGSRVREQAARLRRGEPLAPALLANAFARPLSRLLPDLAALPDQMRRHGASTVALSGAGPSHYAPVSDPEAAHHLAATLAAALGDRARVAVAAPATEPPVIEATKASTGADCPRSTVPLLAPVSVPGPGPTTLGPPDV